MGTGGPWCHRGHSDVEGVDPTVLTGPTWNQLVAAQRAVIKCIYSCSKVYIVFGLKDARASYNTQLNRCLGERCPLRIKLYGIGLSADVSLI